MAGRAGGGLHGPQNKSKFAEGAEQAGQPLGEPPTHTHVDTAPSATLRDIIDN